MPKIRGHRDVDQTVCPGAKLYARLNEIRVPWDGGQPGPPPPGPPPAPPPAPPPPQPSPSGYRSDLGPFKHGMGTPGGNDPFSQQIRTFQNRLADRGWKRLKEFRDGGGKLGHFGDITLTTVQQFQVMHKIAGGQPGQAAHGWVGPKTWDSIFEPDHGPPPPPAPPPAPPADNRPTIPPFPGADKFGDRKRNDFVTQWGRVLVKLGFKSHNHPREPGGYKPGPSWTEYDRLNTRDFQLSRPELRGDPDGIPGPKTWEIGHRLTGDYRG